MQSHRLILLLLLPASLAASAIGAADVAPFLKLHCTVCHNSDARKGKLDLAPVATNVAEADEELIRGILDALVSGSMPPEDSKQPSAAQRQQVVVMLRAMLRASEDRMGEATAYPGQGNLVDHELLFTEPAVRRSATPARLWRLSPHVFMHRANSLSRSPLLRAKRNQGGDGLHPAFAYMTPPHTFRDNARVHAFEEATTELLFDVCWQIAGIQTNSPRAPGPIKILREKKEPTKADWKRLIRMQFGFALRRTPEDDELLPLTILATRTHKQTSTKTTMQTVLAAVLLRPDAVYRFEIGQGEPDEHGRVFLAPRELMHAISFALTDLKPDDELLQAATNGALESREDVKRHVERLLADPVSAPRLLRFFQEYFEYPRAKEIFKDARSAGLIFANDRIDDADRLVVAILKEDRDVLNRLLTQDSMYVLSSGVVDHPVVRSRARNNYLLDFGLPSDWDWEGEQPVKPTTGRRSGMLTHPAWLLAFSDNEKNQAIQRGRWIQMKLLGGTVPETPIGVDATLPTDPDMTLRERMHVTREDYCWRCHQRMDPLGLPLEQFDDFGRFRTRELEKPVDTSGEISIGDPELDGAINDPFEMLQRLGTSTRVEQVFVRHVFRYFLGRNETLDDAPTLIDAHHAYQQNGGSMTALVTSLLTSDSFLYRQSHVRPTTQ
ncbi:MAG: DUF1588 domain-containing protein [Rubripirellula sp.]